MNLRKYDNAAKAREFADVQRCFRPLSRKRPPGKSL